MNKIISSSETDIPILFLIIIFVCCAFSSTVDAEEFGRFFTTPMERQYLDQLKSRGAPIVVKVEDDLKMGDKSKEKKQEINDAVTLKGLVYRKDGKSAAWLNDSNTYEGDIAWGYADVKEDKITPSSVQIRIGTQNNDVSMKVGEKYEPASESIKDLIEEPGADISVKRR